MPGENVDSTTETHRHLTGDQFKIWLEGYHKGVQVGTKVGYDLAVEQSYPELREDTDARPN